MLDHNPVGILSYRSVDITEKLFYRRQSLVGEDIIAHEGAGDQLSIVRTAVSPVRCCYVHR